tara:strand:- start:20251 stop:20889 length:639 start_codon:yes stop_codon:yes gene_type:complete
MKKIAIFGCSGFALEVADVCHAMGYKNIVLLSQNEEIGQINGLEIKSENDIEYLSKNEFVFAIGIGNGSIRKKISEKYAYLYFPNLIHPSAIFGLNQKEIFNEHIGNIITAGVIFTNGIKVGNYGLYNLNSTIGHDCIIEDFVSIMPSVNVSGNVHLKNSCMLGVGAVILQGDTNKKRIVGEHSLVGAQSLVTKDVSAHCTVFGVPAKVIKH